MISIETTDEERAVALVRDVAFELSRSFFEWSMTEGLCPVGAGSVGFGAVVPGGKAAPALAHILEAGPPGIYLFKDLGPHTKDAHVLRMLRDLVAVCNDRKTVLVLVDAAPLPDHVKRFTVHFELGWPTTAELLRVVKNTFKRIKAESATPVSAKVTKRAMEQIIGSLRGLSVAEAERVVAAAIYDDYCLDAEDVPRIVEAKRTLLGSTGCLESIAADFSADEIGGLEKLKSWLRIRQGGFTQAAREFGLEAPRGVLMLGVQGCGKSLCAKVIAADWKMPLLRLDPGVLYQKFIGESESQLRQALRQAEAMAPAVLWIDEIEKAFASANAASADGGLSKRMFGTLLSWMQDHRHPIFIIATANDISALPPELMRKGRFDEIFFVDLPCAAARERILAIHLLRRHRDPAEFDLRELSKAAEGFSGSELEQAVIAGLFAAFSEKRELEDRHLIDEFTRTRPLSVVAAERIDELRNWARDHCVPAD